MTGEQFFDSIRIFPMVWSNNARTDLQW